MYKEILKNGFLDDIIDRVVKNIRESNKDYYEVIYLYNSLGYNVRKKFVKDVTYVELFIINTFIKLHNSFQNYVILSERGAIDDSYIIFRTMLDKYIDITFIIKDKNNINIINNSFINETLITLNKIKQNKLFDIMSKKTINKRISDLSKYKKSENSVAYNTFQKAKETGLLREYIQFRYLSENVHNGLRPLYENLILKNNGIILDSGFNIENFRENLILMIELFRDILNVIISYLNDDSLKEELNLIEDKLKKVIVS